MAARFQKLDRVRRNACFFDEDLVRLPLMMEAGSIHRLLDIKAIIHHAHQDIGYGGDDARPPRRAKHQEELAIFEDDGRSHSAQWTLASANPIALPPNQSIAV